MITQSQHTTIHVWLRKKYGTADRCENKPCMSETSDGYKPDRCHWALRAGKEYEKKRRNFIRLCPKCHWHYDRKNGLIGKYEKYYRVVVHFTNEQGKFIRALAKAEHKPEKEIAKRAMDLLIEYHKRQENA